MADRQPSRPISSPRTVTLSWRQHANPRPLFSVGDFDP